MKIKLLSSRVNAGRRFADCGTILDLPDEEALRMFRAGTAERVSETATAAAPEAAAIRPPQTAARPAAVTRRRN